MTQTLNLNLPLLQPSQAQKHVTVNEALARLDTFVQLKLTSATQTAPPALLSEGVAYAVPTGATGAWAGQQGRVAVVINGGWEFSTPKYGWQAYILDQGGPAIWDGVDWRVGAVSLSMGGAGMRMRTTEVTINLTAGNSVVTAPIFPARSIAFGVTCRVVNAVTGTLGSWQIGVAGDLQRYGTGIAKAVNTPVNTPSAPLVYWSDTPLELRSIGGNFSGGAISVAAHYAILDVPAALPSL